MLLRALSHFFPSDMAVDLGTANTLVYAPGEGIVLNEPSIVALSTADRSVIAVGAQAKAMLGRAPGTIEVVRPLRHGVIADYDTTEKMLYHFIRRAHRRRSPVHPRVVISVPSGITQVERRAVQESASHAGARKVFLIAEPTAAAIGAGLPISEPGASMIVDIGGGTTEVAVISLSGIVFSSSLRIAGDDMNDAIASHVRKGHSLLIGERRSEEIKLSLGSAYPGARDNETIAVKGRDLTAGIPKTIYVSGAEVREALREPIEAIVEAVHGCLEKTPPELAADIVDNGITLTGGGALLPGLDLLLHQQTDLPITISEDPLTCVVRGAGRLLDEPEVLARVSIPV
ncbi:MAG TPA: rod shape-determining protein [Verrucomicrobiae bacterium]|jgi:rod shape-determining protein MreB|nr:rod shape-determining protein [Verrucomicrobiae bacterium]